MFVSWSMEMDTLRACELEAVASRVNVEGVVLGSDVELELRRFRSLHDSYRNSVLLGQRKTWTRCLGALQGLRSFESRFRRILWQICNFQRAAVITEHHALKQKLSDLTSNRHPPQYPYAYCPKRLKFSYLSLSTVSEVSRYPDARSWLAVARPPQILVFLASQ